MARAGSKASMKSVVLLTAAVVVVLALSVVYAPVASATTAIKTYPVHLSAMPKTQKSKPGDSVMVTISEANLGSKTFKATKCVADVVKPGSSLPVAESCRWFKPFSVLPGGTAEQKYIFYPYVITSSTPLGTYEGRVYFTGSVQGEPVKSFFDVFVDVVIPK